MHRDPTTTSLEQEPATTPERPDRGTAHGKSTNDLVRRLQEEERSRHRLPIDDEERVDELVRETFPASDPPGNY